MKKIIFFTIVCILWGCNKNRKTAEDFQKEKTKMVDSINAARTKYNDSIKILNSKNFFRDLSGNHKFTHSSISKSGSVAFINIDRDLYIVSGAVKWGKNYAKIEGEIKMVNNQYLNFTGEITQSLEENDNGKIDIRSKKTTFAKKGNERFWRLQNKVNNAGFVDNIDIY